MSQETVTTKSALESLCSFYEDCGIDWLTEEQPQDQITAYQQQLEQKAQLSAPSVQDAAPQKQFQPTAGISAQAQSASLMGGATESADVMATPEAVKQAVELAEGANTLDDLKKAIEGFEGLAIKHTASRMVFASGNPQAPLMVIGEAPGGDEDRQGEVFVGEAGHLLDKMLAAISCSRQPKDSEISAYLSNVINWRPPGNRTPTPQEIEISLPFIERHIQLAEPKVIFLLGNVAAQNLLGRQDGISKLRGQWMEWEPKTIKKVDGFSPIPVLASYHPAFLLKNSMQKRKSWQDLLSLKERLKTTAKQDG